MASEAQARADARIAGVEWGQQAEGWGSIEGFAGGTLRHCCDGVGGKGAASAAARGALLCQVLKGGEGSLLLQNVY